MNISDHQPNIEYHPIIFIEKQSKKKSLNVDKIQNFNAKNFVKEKNKKKLAKNLTDLVNNLLAHNTLVQKGDHNKMFINTNQLSSSSIHPATASSSSPTVLPKFMEIVEKDHFIKLNNRILINFEKNYDVILNLNNNLLSNENSNNTSLSNDNSNNSCSNINTNNSLSNTNSNNTLSNTNSNNSSSNMNVNNILSTDIPSTNTDNNLAPNIDESNDKFWYRTPESLQRRASYPFPWENLPYYIGYHEPQQQYVNKFGFLYLSSVIQYNVIVHLNEIIINWVMQWFDLKPDYKKNFFAELLVK